MSRRVRKQPSAQKKSCETSLTTNFAKPERLIRKAVEYCLHALRTFQGMSPQEVAGVAMETASLGQGGLDVNTPLSATCGSRQLHRPAGGFASCTLLWNKSPQGRILGFISRQNMKKRCGFIMPTHFDRDRLLLMGLLHLADHFVASFPNAALQPGNKVKPDLNTPLPS